MKKVILTFLICIYALSSFGIGVREFYCCGKLKSVDFSFVQEAKEKSDNGDGDHGGCCKTQHQFFKVKDNHMASYYVVNTANPFILLYRPIPEFKIPIHLSGQIISDYRNHAPPQNPGVPDFISNRVFLI